MPSTYAHYVFGKRMLDVFPQEIAALARAHRQLYDIGLHGPDILFYYHPLGSNRVNSVGFGTHGRPASEFFAPAKKAAEAGGDAAFAYLKIGRQSVRARFKRGSLLSVEHTSS